MLATRWPAFIRATVTCIEVVDFPEPPFSFPSTITCPERGNPTGACSNITPPLTGIIFRIEPCRRQANVHVARSFPVNSWADPRRILRREPGGRAGIATPRCRAERRGLTGMRRSGILRPVGRLPARVSNAAALQQAEVPELAPHALRHRGAAGGRP